MLKAARAGTGSKGSKAKLEVEVKPKPVILAAKAPAYNVNKRKAVDSEAESVQEDNGEESKVGALCSCHQEWIKHSHPRAAENPDGEIQLS